MGSQLKRPNQFQRGRGRRLPGQSSEEELGLGLTIRYVDRPSHTVINKELIRIGNIGAGRYVEIDHDGQKFKVNGLVHIHNQN